VNKIDVKDKKILFELDMNCRQSLSQIGKKVGLSKSIVAYRINRLKKIGVIKGYYTVIDLYKLGFISPRFHFVYQYITPEKQREIIKYFTHNNYTFIVVSTYGPFDLSVLFGIHDIRKLYAIWKDIQSKFGYYFEKQSMAFYLNEIHLPLCYLKEEKIKKDKKSLNLSGIQDHITLDEIEIKLLNLLADNAQLSLTKLAKQLSLTARQVSYRINKLKDNGIIEAFRVELDISKLGYQDFKVYLFLKEFKLRKPIMEYIFHNPHLICIDETTGESHLELEFHLRSIDDLNKIVQDISEKFPSAIRNYYYVTVKKLHKWLYLPKISKNIQ
jgi:Lrp/AsnC family leucine-responsive transcriptional regulator